jgi:hypothetical protein
VWFLRVSRIANQELPMSLRSSPVIACLALVLAACLSTVGDTDAGPNAAGGYYDGPNVNVGHVNPWRASYESQEYSTVGGKPADQLF